LFLRKIKYNFTPQLNNVKYMNRFAMVLTGILSVLAFGVANAQQDAQFSQYMFNNLYTNPGYAGLEGAPKFTAIHRTQWAGYGDGSGGGAPQDQILTASIPVHLLKGGVGVQLTHDKIGPNTNLDVLISYAYHINLGGGKLGLGLRSGILNSYSGGPRVATDPNDVVVENLDNKNLNQMSPDFALGVFYNHSKFYVGASLNHLVKQKLSDLGKKQSRHMFVNGGYNYQVASNVLLTPSLITKYDAGSDAGSNSGKWSTEVSVMATFSTRYWAGLSLRQQDALIPFVGLSFLKNNAMKLGFAYDYTLINQSGKATSSYEIMLSYSLPAFVPPVKPVIRTPRYRF